MQIAYRPGYSGSGPGDITPDGCAVELYRRLPVDNEPEVIAAAAPPPATLLELGCGVGRVTRPLTDLGYAVTAVDESRAMLDQVTGVDAGAGVRSVRVEYVFPDASWTQTFLSRPLTPAQFEQALADAGLALDRYLTPDGIWAGARPSE